jgi:hypothetical protein
MRLAFSSSIWAFTAASSFALSSLNLPCMHAVQEVLNSAGRLANLFEAISVCGHCRRTIIIGTTWNAAAHLDALLDTLIRAHGLLHLDTHCLLHVLQNLLFQGCKLHALA